MSDNKKPAHDPPRTLAEILELLERLKTKKKPEPEPVTKDEKK